MQTVGKRSDSTGCHSGVARLCRNACLEQGKACTGSSPFLQGHESHHFQEIFILLQKFCYAVVQMVPSHGWLAQPRQPVCLTLPSPLCSLSTVSWNVDVFIHFHLTVRPSQLAFRCHFGYPILKSHLLAFLKLSLW